MQDLRRGLARLDPGTSPFINSEESGSPPWHPHQHASFSTPRRHHQCHLQLSRIAGMHA